MGITTEEPPMQSNGTFRVNWLNVNVPTIIALMGVGWGIASYINDLEDRVRDSEAFRIQRTAQTDKKFDNIEAQLNSLNTIPIRVQSLEREIEATNARLDRLVEALTGNVEMVRKDIAGLTTKVEVLGSKIDNLTPTGQRRAEAWTPPRIAK